MSKDPWDNEFQPPDPWEPAPTPPEPNSHTGLLVTPSRRELLIALIYLPLHLFVIGDIVLELLLHFGSADSTLNQLLTQLNLLYMLTGTVVLMLAMRRYLQASFVRFLAFGTKNIRVLLTGYSIRFVLAFAVGIILSFLTPEVGAGPNEEVLREIVDYSLLPSLFLTVILAPIVEELLFRAAIFAPLLKRNRFLAYFVSTFLFAFIHILHFLSSAPLPMLLTVMLFYIPAGAALAWVYEKSGNIWTAIILHGLMNLIAILLGSVIF
ncbi:MAG: CPBP family intramembrane metalloprotease [Oscillospiraceae bacterium]|nr:CPBP family intramembrane metalloprotease [Oscillospiraceae bacterium]